MAENTRLEVALREWALKKAFGPTLDALGEDLKRLNAVGRDKILANAYRKIDSRDQGKAVNLRITRDVLWNGAFTEEEICAEYFGGILASSRSENGSDDSSIYYVEVIKGLSSKQLRLHYVIYNSLNKLLAKRGSPVNVAQGTEIHAQNVWFSAAELVDALSLRIDSDLNILHREGLLIQYKTGSHVEGTKAFPYASVSPTTFGVLLYAAAHNKIGEWRKFAAIEFGDFPDIQRPRFCALNLDDLLIAVGLKESKKPAT
jgi:hypothetical protein